MDKSEIGAHSDVDPIQLRMKLWRTRGRNSRAAGIVLLITSGVFLSLAYVTRYIVFEVISILALFLGVVFVFGSVERHVKLQVANQALLSSLFIIRDLLSEFGVDSRGIYIPTEKAGSVKIFLPKSGSSSLLEISKATNDTTVLEDGLVMPPIGNGLFQLYEEELGDIRSFDIDYLKEWLPQVLVDRLNVTERSEMTQEGDDIHARLTGSSFSELCQDKEVAQLCDTVGCPVTSSIAEAIARNTERIVYYDGCVYDPKTRTIEATYRLGPTLEDLRRKESSETSQSQG